MSSDASSPLKDRFALRAVKVGAKYRNRVLPTHPLRLADVPSVSDYAIAIKIRRDMLFLLRKRKSNCRPDPGAATLESAFFNLAYRPCVRYPALNNRNSQLVT